LAVHDIGVVYLYRFAEGEYPVRRFIQSYFEYPAGVSHDLYVIFKGFPDWPSLALAQSLFANIPINSIELEDSGYDIGSYREAAKVATNRRLIFFNTFSQILSRDWLAHFDRALSLPRVGLVGASGSWHANTSSYEGALKALIYRIRQFPARLLGNYRSRVSTGGTFPMRKRPLLRYLLSPFGYLYCFVEFGRHPNPHIRTNAFMIERSRFLSLGFPSFKKKGDVYKFESGRRSMTKQIMAQGLLPVVVGRAGKVYSVSEWKSSSTFWANDQVNLIVADNRTADYAAGDRELRKFLEDSAWVHPWSWRTSTLNPLQCGNE
jgi:hypothetical protein